MSLEPITEPQEATRLRLVGTSVTRYRRTPTPRRLAQRRLLIQSVKLVLPVLALALLTTMV
ncbi:MAG: hypothetical protein ACREF3_19110, partial [Acetobacteraceae bacterium]